MTNYLLRAWHGKDFGERWCTWEEAQSAREKLKRVGYTVTIMWLDPDCILRDVTDRKDKPE